MSNNDESSGLEPFFAQSGAGGSSKIAVAGSRSNDDSLQPENTEGRMWARGTKLPPAPTSSEGNNKNSKHAKDDLWDSVGPASDFTEFGALPGSLGGGKMEKFDLCDMANAASAFEEEMAALRLADKEAAAKTVNNSNNNNNNKNVNRIDTIMRSAGDNVNVFEDIGDDDGAASHNNHHQQSSNIHKSNAAGSRLMQMIGAGSTSSGESSASLSAAPIRPSLVPSNPWGTSSKSSSSKDAEAAAKEAAAAEAENAARLEREEAAAEAAKLAAAEEARENARRNEAAAEASAVAQQASALAQQQLEAAEAQQRAAALAAYNAQVESVLMERICALLEANWGKVEINSVLSTLHREDERVIPLLRSTDELRSLIIRNVNRVQLVKVNGNGAEFAVLVTNNNPLQQQQAALQQQQQQAAQQQAAARQQVQAAEAAAIAKLQADARERERLLLLHEQQQQAAAIAAQKQQLAGGSNNAWYYADPQGAIQGPFKGEEMRQWLSAGYFKGDLPICTSTAGPFLPLSSIFPNPSIAFEPVVDNSAAIAAAAAAEEEKKRMEEAAAAATAAAEAKKKTEIVEKKEARKKKQQQQKEAQAAAAAASQKDADALKNLLGVGQQQQEPSQKQPQAPVQQKKAAAAPAPAAPAPQPAWGGAAIDNGTGKGKNGAKGSRKQSLQEIQEEEKRVERARAKEQGRQGEGNSKQGGGGWAGVAGSGGGWASGVSAPSPKEQQQQQVRVKQQQQAMAASQQLSVAATQQKKKQQPQQAAAPAVSSSSSDAANFGSASKMDSALEAWCKVQMKKVHEGEEDPSLTCVNFCMTLDDPMDIREYFRIYIGDSQAVANFASEFIARKGGTNSGGKSKNGVSEQWETGGKKGKKGKNKSAANVAHPIGGATR